MIDREYLAKCQAELEQMQIEREMFEYFARSMARRQLVNALREERRQETVARRRAMQEFTNQRMIVGERILRGLYSPNSEVGNP